jgi:hypothetical protein
MNCSRVLLLASLLLIPAGFGCGKKGGSGDAADGKSSLTRDKILGAWLLEKTETDGAPGKDVWEFKGGGYEHKDTYTLKTVSDRELVLGREKGSDLRYKRKGAAPAGKGKRDKLIGRWQASGGYEVFGKDGKWVSGAIAQDENDRPIDVEVYWGTFKLDGNRLTTLQKADGLAHIKEQGMDFTRTPWEIQGDKLAVAGSLMGKFTYTVKTDGDNRLVLVDPKGKKREFTRQVAASGGSKQDLIVGTWDVVKSETGLDPGNSVTFTKDGKYTAEVGGTKLGGTYKVEGDTLKQLADGSKIEVAKTIRTLTATALVTEDANRKVDELKKK